MKPEYNLDRLMEEQKKKNMGPGDATHVSEHVNLSLQTKPSKEEVKVEKK